MNADDCCRSTLVTTSRYNNPNWWKIRGGKRKEEGVFGLIFLANLRGGGIQKEGCGKGASAKEGHKNFREWGSWGFNKTLWSCVNSAPSCLSTSKTSISKKQNQNQLLFLDNQLKIQLRLKTHYFKTSADFLAKPDIITVLCVYNLTKSKDATSAFWFV